MKYFFKNCIALFFPIKSIGIAICVYATVTAILFACAAATVESTGYRVVYTAGDGVTGVTGMPDPPEVIAPIGTDYALSSATPSRDGYTFEGWTLTPDGTAAVTILDADSYSAVVKVYPIWKGKTYLVHYSPSSGVANAAGLPAEPLSATFGTAITLNATATRPGYNFGGWALTDHGTTAVTSLKPTAYSDNVTVYAIWIPAGSAVISSVFYNKFTVSLAPAVPDLTVTNFALDHSATVTGASTVDNGASYVILTSALDFAIPVTYTLSLTCPGEPFNSPTIMAPAALQTFNASATWTAPSGCSQVYVFVVGGGGSGCAASASGGGGGGGGGFIRQGTVTVTPGSTYTVTVGAGGVFATSGVKGDKSALSINGTDLLWAAGGDPGIGYSGGHGSGGGGSYGAAGGLGFDGGTGMYGTGGFGINSAWDRGGGTATGLSTDYLNRKIGKAFGGGGGGASATKGGSGGGFSGGASGTESGSNGAQGIANTGGGGGGACFGAAGGNGGSGIVVLYAP